MIEIFTTQRGELGFLNIERYGVPPIGSTLIRDKVTYKVVDVIFNDDEGTVSITVASEATPQSTPTGKISNIPSDLEQEVIRLIQKMDILAAIKRVKEVTGLGLIESKDIIYRYRKLLGI